MAIKDRIVKVIRKPMIKIIIRIMLYGWAAMLGSAAISPEITDVTSHLGKVIASAIIVVISSQLDFWHHKKDTNT